MQMPPGAQPQYPHQYNSQYGPGHQQQRPPPGPGPGPGPGGPMNMPYQGMGPGGPACGPVGMQIPVGGPVSKQNMYHSNRPSPYPNPRSFSYSKRPQFPNGQQVGAAAWRFVEYSFLNCCIICINDAV